jgi:hypothetical protein
MPFVTSRQAPTLDVGASNSNIKLFSLAEAAPTPPGCRAWEPGLLDQAYEQSSDSLEITMTQMQGYFPAEAAPTPPVAGRGSPACLTKLMSRAWEPGLLDKTYEESPTIQT